jgi:excisionase family DNA binding protein
MMFEQYNDLVTVEELCEMLFIGKNAAYKLLSSKQLKAFRYNRVWKIPKQGVIEYIQHQSKLA